MSKKTLNEKRQTEVCLVQRKSLASSVAQCLHTQMPSISSVACAISIGFAVLVSDPTQAATFSVTNTNNAGLGSLREAVINANAAAGADTINFSSLSGTITLTTGQIEITDDLTINGPGADLLTVSGNNASRVIAITNGAVTISKLTIADGNNQDLSGGYVTANGGGISVIPTPTKEASLHVIDSVIRDNVTMASGGGISGRCSYVPSTQGYGGTVQGLKFITIENTTIANNVAGSGGGLSYEDCANELKGLEIKNSTISGNGVQYSGGGISQYANGVTIENSTISDNNSVRGGGAMFWFIDSRKTIIKNSTITSNFGENFGGGIYTNYGSVPIMNTVIAGNKTYTSDNDLHESSGGFNVDYSLIQSPGSATIIETIAGSNIIGQDPIIGPLRDNGGLTFTHALLANSPAINRGDPNFLSPPQFDQRGTGFPRVGNSRIDIGAFEFDAISGQSGQGTWETTLQGRDLDGNPETIEAYYDTVLDITWLANTHAAGITMSWAAANNWAMTLDVNGVTGWRLPTVNPIDGTTADDATFAIDGSEDGGLNVSAPGTAYAGSTASEMAHMFYNTLGNLSDCNPTTSTASSCDLQAGAGLTNTGPFYNFKLGYWSDTEYAPNTDLAWWFRFYDGGQEAESKDTNLNAWAVHSGDVGAVPAAYCDLPIISVAGNCADEIVARSIADIDAYVASNFGRHINANGYLTYKNLRLVGAIGQAGTPLDVTSPCRITVNANAALTGSDINLHARMGMVANWSADIDASGKVCLISDKRGMFLNGGNVINANALAMRGNQKAFIGIQSTLNINGPAELVSTGIGENSQVKVGNKTDVTADSFIMAADNTAEVAFEANVTSTGNLSISTGNLASSETLLNARSSLQAGSDIELTSGGKTNISFHATVSAGNNLEVSAKTTGDCTVASITSITYSSKSGNCADKLP